MEGFLILFIIAVILVLIALTITLFIYLWPIWLSILIGILAYYFYIRKSFDKDADRLAKARREKEQRNEELKMYLQLKGRLKDCSIQTHSEIMRMTLEKDFGSSTLTQGISRKSYETKLENNKELFNQAKNLISDETLFMDSSKFANDLKYTSNKLDNLAEDAEKAANRKLEISVDEKNIIMQYISARLYRTPSFYHDSFFNMGLKRKDRKVIISQIENYFRRSFDFFEKSKLLLAENFQQLVDELAAILYL